MDEDNNFRFFADKKSKIKKYTEKHRFMSYDKFENKILSYTNIDNIKIQKFYYLLKNIYNNLDNEKIIISKATEIYNLTTNKRLAFEYLQVSIYLIDTLLEKSRNIEIRTYGRKMEFIYQDVCEDWMA